VAGGLTELKLQLLIGMTSFPFVLMRRTSQAVFRTRRTGRDVVWDQETEKKL
jgi:hypothetical protein